MAKVIGNGLGIELRGSAGSAVFAQTRYGLVMRPRTQPNNPRTPAQIAARARFAACAEAWKGLTPARYAAWQAYARTVTRYHAYGGLPYSPAPHTLFIALGSKFLQVNPDRAIPLDPPAAPLLGDGITVTAAGGAGRVIFTASGANAVGVVTELLLQPLAHAARAPKANLYRTQAFVGFTPGGLTAFVTAPPGWFAPAIRFVNAATGQETDRIALAVVRVAEA